MKLLATLAAAALAVTLLPAGGAGAGHNVQRGVSLHYKQKAKKFKGRIRSEPPICLEGTVTLYKIKKRRADKLLGSTTAAADGSWSMRRKVKRGRFYATTGRYETASGTVCRSARSPVLKLGGK